jgi:hypothetical protein
LEPLDISKDLGGMGGPCNVLEGGGLDETPSLLVVLPPLLLTYMGSGVNEGVCKFNNSPVVLLVSVASSEPLTSTAEVSAISLRCCLLKYSRSSPCV